MGEDETLPVPEGWLEAIEESDADYEAGRIVPASEVHALFRRVRDEIAADRAAAAGEPVEGSAPIA